MKATLMYRSGDVRVVEVPEPEIQEPTDAILRVTYACVCGSDLHPYHDLGDTPEGRRMGHEAIGVVEQIGGAVSTLAVGHGHRALRLVGRHLPLLS
jgi:threonine dehydrogenase-like Zn-dependent dehydrogenase